MLLPDARKRRTAPIRTAILLLSAALLVLSASSRSLAQRTTCDVIVQRDVMVPMRDGVKLATDVYLPAVGEKPVEGRFPALLMRTAYDKERWGPDIVRFFARHGYVSVTQDCRGRYKSQGRFFPGWMIRKTATTPSNGSPVIRAATGAWACTARHRTRQSSDAETGRFPMPRSLTTSATTPSVSQSQRPSNIFPRPRGFLQAGMILFSRPRTCSPG